MMSQLLNVATGMRLLQVPYNGVAPALQDTVVGRTQVVLVSSAAMSPYLKRGDLRPIAVTSSKRVSGLESVPTMAETYPGFEYVGWFALVAPTGTPEAIVRKVNADVNAVLAKDDIQKRLLELGAINEGPGSPEQLAQFLKDERVRWAKLVKDINLQPE
jgi:tripartite-type tricarboxylate transporter receptor subunit TctC